MTRRGSLVPIPAPLERALHALRGVQPPTALKKRLDEALERAGKDTDSQTRKRRLLLLSGLSLAVLAELAPLAAAAQPPATQAQQPQAQQPLAQQPQAQQPQAQQPLAQQPLAQQPLAQQPLAEPTSPPTAPPSSMEEPPEEPVAEPRDTRVPEQQPSAPPPVPAGSAPAASGPAASRAAANPPPTPPPSTPSAHMDVSLQHGVRFVAPELANFTVELHMSAWFRYNVDSFQPGALTGADGFHTTDYFSVNLVRPQLAMSAFDELIRAYFQPELAGSAGPRLLDAQLEVVAAPEIAVRVGQYRVPFSRAWITSLMQLQFPDRGAIANFFAANAAGRDTGAMVYGTPLDGMIEYYAGIYNGNGIDTDFTTNTPTPMAVARFVVTPVGHMPYGQTPSLDHDDVGALSFGTSGYYREAYAASGSTQTNRYASGGVDAAAAFGSLYIQAEGFLKGTQFGSGTPISTPWTLAWGTYAQAGYFVLPKILEISARAGWGNPAFSNGAATMLTGGLVQFYEGAIGGYFALGDTYYGQHLKLLLNYRFADNQSGQTFANEIPVGSSHRVIAQAQLWF